MKTIITCDKCQKKMRIPTDKTIQFSCPKCKSTYISDYGFITRKKNHNKRYIIATIALLFAIGGFLLIYNIAGEDTNISKQEVVQVFSIDELDKRLDEHYENFQNDSLTFPKINQPEFKAYINPENISTDKYFEWADGGREELMDRMMQLENYIKKLRKYYESQGQDYKNEKIAILSYYTDWFFLFYEWNYENFILNPECTIIPTNIANLDQVMPDFKDTIYYYAKKYEEPKITKKFDKEFEKANIISGKILGNGNSYWWSDKRRRGRSCN